MQIYKKPWINIIYQQIIINILNQIPYFDINLFVTSIIVAFDFSEYLCLCNRTKQLEVQGQDPVDTRSEVRGLLVTRESQINEIIEITYRPPAPHTQYDNADQTIIQNTFLKVKLYSAHSRQRKSSVETLSVTVSAEFWRRIEWRNLTPRYQSVEMEISFSQVGIELIICHFHTCTLVYVHHDRNGNILQFVTFNTKIS